MVLHVVIPNTSPFITFGGGGGGGRHSVLKKGGPGDANADKAYNM